jgi:hypothetical protein
MKKKKKKLTQKKPPKFAISIKSKIKMALEIMNIGKG